MVNCGALLLHALRPLVLVLLVPKLVRLALLLLLLLLVLGPNPEPSAITYTEN